MDSLLIGIQGLNTAQTKDEFVNALWDLRDSAHDNPELWRAFSAEMLFQSLASALEELPADRHGQISMLDIARALGRASDPRRSKSD